jgi:hypothetical protein
MTTDADDDHGSLVLSDLINRVLDKGVVIRGNVLISVADIDLIALDLRLLLTSIERTQRSLLKNADPPVLPDR